MSGIWRLILFLYNLLFLGLGGLVLMAAIGRPEPVEYINLVLSTPQNRVITGTIALLLVALAVFLLVFSLKGERKPDSIIVENSVIGQVSITVPAIKVIITKAVKKVEGVKEVKSIVKSDSAGLVIKIHTMINPEYRVPEMSQNIQKIVKQYLEDIGGLTVSEVRILIDDFAGAQKPAGN